MRRRKGASQANARGQFRAGILGYSAEQAVAELIEGAMGARGRDGISIRVALDFAAGSVSVEDDGLGMDLGSMRAEMAAGRPAGHGGDSLGMFGPGMRRTCSMLGRRFTVSASTAGSPKACSVDYDEESFPSEGRNLWDALEVSCEDKASPWHGTRIRVSCLNVPLYPQQARTFLARFGARYAQYIEHENVTIRINENECVPAEPELMSGKHALDIKLDDGNRISGWIGITKKSLARPCGIVLYKDKRAVRTSDKFGFPNLRSSDRLVGALHLDHVPTNPQKAEFVEDSAEYVGAEMAFRDSATVKSLMAQCSKPGLEPIRAIVDYITHGTLSGKIAPHVGLAASGNMRGDFRPFEFQHGNSRVRFDFAYGSGDGLYTIDTAGSVCSITVDRNSRVFPMVRNPHMLLAMIWEEAKLALRHPGKHDEFVRTRNASWARFADTALDHISDKRSKRKYRHLSPLLDRVQDALASSYSRRYQLTALCVLEPYLHYAQRNLYYTIITERHQGEYMRELLASRAGEDMLILHRPTREQFEFLPHLTYNTAFVIIREYANVQASKVASKEKAILDLYGEMRRGMPIGIHDIKMLVNELRDNDEFSVEKLNRMARHRNIDPGFYMRGGKERG